MKRKAQRGWWDTRAQHNQPRIAATVQRVVRYVRKVTAYVTKVQADAVQAWLKAVLHPPILSVSDWNAFEPIKGQHKPLAYMALTSEGHTTIPQKRVIAAGNSLSDSDKLRLAANRIGAMATA